MYVETNKDHQLTWSLAFVNIEQKAVEKFYWDSRSSVRSFFRISLNSVLIVQICEQGRERIKL